MAAKCLNPIRFCAFRVTLLEVTGAVAAGPNNSYVSGKGIQIQETLDIDEGTERVVRNGCDCIGAQYKPDPILKRRLLQLDRDALEPALESLMLGDTLILDGSDPVGIADAELGVCSTTSRPRVAFEAWLEAYDVDHPDADVPYIHFVWPATTWTPGGTLTFGSDFMQPSLSGFSRENDLWGHGPYGDQVTPNGTPIALSTRGYFYTDVAPPDTACGFASVSPAS
jgi:hypothetical protein